MDSLQLLFWTLALGWTVFVVVQIQALFAVPELPALEASFGRPPGQPPRASVIIPTRDADERLAPAVARWNRQLGVEVEVLVIDDRSEHSAAAAIKALEGGPIRVVRIDELPEGWLGKSYACHVGSTHASSDWLLFTDADVWVTPDVIARSILAARQHKAEHVVLLPVEHRATFWARATSTFLGVVFVSTVARVNRDRRGACLGIGAFNLVRADAYLTAGGHKPLRYEVIDDVKLGLMLRRAGFRTRAFGSAGSVEVEWGSSVRRIFGAVEKNLFAIFGYRTWLALLAVFVPLLGWLATMIAPWNGSVAGLAAFGGLMSIALPALRLSIKSGWGVLPALASPLTLPLTSLMSLRAVWLTLKRGGIEWRGTFYPLGELRRRRVPWSTIRGGPRREGV